LDVEELVAELNRSLGVTLVTVGLNHRLAPLALRERVAIVPRELGPALHSLCATADLREIVILSTCNRVELYAAVAEPSAASGRLVDFLAFRSRLSPEVLGPSLYQLSGAEAVRHLFRVAAGLDSMILGESEITAQVKQAYELAKAHGATGPILNRLFQKSLHSAKLVRSHTRVAEGQASIGSVVVALTRQLFGDPLRERDVLLWGAGKTAEVTARHLIKSGVRQLWIVNRTQPKAEDLARLCQGGWLSWEQALKHLAHVDIAIVCTQAPHYVIDQGDLETIRPERHGRPLCLIDLAVPRNIDPALKSEPGVHLYDIDGLQATAEAGRAARAQELVRCDELIDGQVRHFVSTKDCNACHTGTGGL
jgi:glutamyl-tRNA reductase